MAARNGRAHALTRETGRLYVSANRLGWMISIFRDDDPPEDLSKPKSRGRPDL